MCRNSRASFTWRNFIFETWREVVPRVELAQPEREGAFEIS
jgi:hypothetical protein